MGGACRTYGGEKSFRQSFGGKLGSPRHRWEDNIKMDLQEAGWGGMDWLELAQNRDRWRVIVKD